MSFFAYTQNIPNPPNNPSTDVPNMQTNTNSVFSWPLVDHYGYEDTNNYGGWHKQITLVSLGNNPTLPPLTSGNSELYTNTVPTVGGEKTELFFTPDTTGNVYQMTRTSSVYYPSFADDAQYAQTPPVATQFGGWTFLPGGLLLQYGSEENLTATGTVKFFNETKGFGFITPSSGGQDVFVHSTGLIDEIRENDKVEFEVENGRKGLNAVNVKVI